MADATIQTGEKLQLNFDVENRGTRRGSQTVELLLDGTVVDEAAVVLDSTETGQLVLETDAFSDDDGGEVFVVETVIGTRTEATFEVEVTTIPDSVVDDFESGDLSEYSGDKTNWGITTTNAPEGSNALEITGTTSPDKLISLEDNGLDYYPAIGDKVSVLLRDISSANLPGFNFGLSDDGSGLNGYRIEHHPNGNDVIISRLDDGSRDIIHRPDVTLENDTWYDYELQWHDGSGSQSEGTIELTIFEVDTDLDLSVELGRTNEVTTLTTTDDTHTTGRGVGFANGSSGVEQATHIDRYWHLGRVD